MRMHEIRLGLPSDLVEGASHAEAPEQRRPVSPDYVDVRALLGWRPLRGGAADEMHFMAGCGDGVRPGRDMR